MSEMITTIPSSTSKSSYSLLKNKTSLICADILSFGLAFFLIGMYFISSEQMPTIEDSFRVNDYRMVAFWGVASVTIFSFWSKYRHYTYRKPFWSELKEIFSLLAIMALIDMLLLSFNKLHYSLLQWFFIWGALFVLIPVTRALVKKILDRLGYWKVPSVIIGSDENAREAYLAINSEKSMGFDVKAFIDPEKTALDNSFICGIPLLDTEQYSNSELYNVKVFIALEFNQRELRDHWIRRLSSKGMRNISVIPVMRGIPLYSTEVSHFFSHEVMMLRLNNNLVRKSSRFLKRSFDIVVSSILLTMLSPLFIYVGWRVSRDGGPPTYGHERVGFNGKKFKCLKFRSMVMNSQEVLAELLNNSAEARSEWDKDFKLKNDPRVTKVGAFLRKTSLDEFPQLWNVFKGEMSLVGPRPIIDEELLRYKEDAEYYLMAKPGMSGLWQVSGRNDVDYDIRVYLDSWYVKNWSLWTDIAILFKTVGVVLNRDGAY
jgi:Undecaprenyl-phosphate galactose phosphotransferase WbaP